MPAGFQTVGFNANESGLEGVYRSGLGNTYQGGWAAVRRAMAGDTAALAVTGGTDVNNWLLLEVTDADLIEWFVQRPQLTDPTHFVHVRRKQPYDSLDLAFFEHDGTGTVLPDNGTVVKQFSQAEFSDSFNHCAVVVDISDEGDLTGSLSSNAAYPVVFGLSLAKLG